MIKIFVSAIKNYPELNGQKFLAPFDFLSFYELAVYIV